MSEARYVIELLKWLEIDLMIIYLIRKLIKKLCNGRDNADEPEKYKLHVFAGSNC